ncbi:MAG: TlpA family protein disulfide reductase [Dehalococcoidia bacterium]|nr:TlpA family protein disulfide reductase [Dehalococcoidia bacterium]
MSQRIRVLLAVLVPVVALFALFAVTLVRTGGKPAGIGINSAFGSVVVEARSARPFSLQMLSGTTISLEDLHGKVVMIDFWSSWCPPCRDEAPTLERVYKQYQDKNVAFLGVAIWDTNGDVQKFIERNKLTYPIGMDNQGKIAIDYGVRGIPEKYFIDRQGTLVRKFIGPVDDEQLSKVLDELLAKP